MKYVLFALILAVGLSAAAPVKDVKCELCAQLVHYIDDWLVSGAGQQEIEILVKKFCEMVGPEYEPICDAILEVEVKQVCFLFYFFF